MHPFSCIQTLEQKHLVSSLAHSVWGLQLIEVAIWLWIFGFFPLTTSRRGESTRILLKSNDCQKRNKHEAIIINKMKGCPFSYEHEPLTSSLCVMTFRLISGSGMTTVSPIRTPQLFAMLYTITTMHVSSLSTMPNVLPHTKKKTLQAQTFTLGQESLRRYHALTMKHCLQQPGWTPPCPGQPPQRCGHVWGRRVFEVPGCQFGPKGNETQVRSTDPALIHLG